MLPKGERGFGQPVLPLGTAGSPSSASRQADRTEGTPHVRLGVTCGGLYAARGERLLWLWSPAFTGMTAHGATLSPERVHLAGKAKI
jgi:hypothetical protein